ncbi:N-acyl homoserine lactonase family protein [Actibacterium sp. 188UL27-1]|uniref:N-acyl homoserine lactonase family protein n=1 Tax=Actibacterium sp. 188UL27-1 TaxID=2786961 RepID=UPI001EF74668|nr:N-acyl homoserine lactonase family protein [Actibacterium sp. 188UL27-1]
MFDDNHDAPCPIDFFLWVLQRDGEVILVDTGFDATEGARRGRPIRLDPAEALAPLGLRAADITTLICTHLHFDHAGGLHLFPNAQIHLQAAEMQYATGPCMCHDALRFPFTVDHICEAVRRLYQGRITFHDGDGQVADGVTVHQIGGHTKGLQAVRVETEAGALCLASDAAHFYENISGGKPFPIVVDLEAMLNGFKQLRTLASRPALIIPGHDPLVRQIFPAHPNADFITRLDRGPTGSVPL